MERLLVAGNTAEGFVNLFGDFIAGSRTTYLKGGSGVGKSTFKRVCKKGGRFGVWNN